MKHSLAVCCIFLITFLSFHLLTQQEHQQSSQQDQKLNGNNGDNENFTNLQINYNKLPTVMIAIAIRNKAHTLPYFFTYLENLNYPKDRLALWIRSDHNNDNSIEIIHTWLNKTSHLYHQIDFKYDESPISYKNESSITDWPEERFLRIIHLKELALKKANQLWADFIFFLDADVFLTNPDTLSYLTSLNLPIVSPMLLSEGLYSNFWCGMTSSYYYKRTDEYTKIYDYEKTGSFSVPMIYSAVLINLNNAQTTLLTFDKEKLIQLQKEKYNENLSYLQNNDVHIYDGPVDDIITFAISASTVANLSMYINNEKIYGYILMPLEPNDPLEKDIQQLINIKLNIINDLSQKLIVKEELQKFILKPNKHRISLDHIYMINLERRQEKRLKMEACFQELGLDVEHFPAVDGRNLNVRTIQKMGIQFLPDYEDPYHRRQMTMGEIGCFLSHYYIWQKMIENQQEEVLILEDDIRFQPYFNERALNVLEQARKIGNWDLIYFGRKRLENQQEPWVNDTNNLVHVGYSYWTLGYVITLSGAKKLIAGEPLKHLVPVDEYLPIMFNRHPNETWVKAFENRNLIAFSASPLLLYPTHYTGEEGYISDTENSEITSNILHTSEAQMTSDKHKNDAQELNAILDGDFSKHHIAETIAKHDHQEF